MSTKRQNNQKDKYFVNSFLYNPNYECLLLGYELVLGEIQRIAKDEYYGSFSRNCR